MMPTKRNYNQVWMPSFLNDFFDNDWLAKSGTTEPSINVLEDEQKYTVEVAAPGMKKEDFNIHLSDDNELVIAGEKKDEKKDENKKYLRREFSYSKFEQTFTLPDDVDKEKIEANVNDGVLSIELPKHTPEEKAKAHRVIEIK